MKITTFFTSAICLSFASTIAAETPKSLLEASIRKWQTAKKECSGNYSYQVITSSMTGYRTVTTITVKNSKVAERKFEVFNPVQPLPGNNRGSKDGYVETGKDIGSHSRGGKPRTLDELYVRAAQVIAKDIPDHEKLYLKFDASGLLKCCFTVDTRIMDDVPAKGVNISNLLMANKKPSGKQGAEKPVHFLTGIADKLWILEKAGKASFKNPAKASLTIKQDCSVSGTSFVNRFFGKMVTYEKEKVSVGPLGTTRMGGSPQMMAQEKSFLTMLDQAVRITLTPGKKLKIEVKSGDFLLFAEKKN